VAQCDASGERRVRPFTGRFEAVEAREVVGDVLVGLDLVPAGDRRLVVREPQYSPSLAGEFEFQ